MKVVHKRCCGLDVHQKNVTACLITPEGREIRTFETMTEHLEKLSCWLVQNGCTHVAMESTGVYWEPIFNILEATGMELLLVNAQHVKALKGRKTDVKDAQWIAELLQHGMIHGSFVPPRHWRELRQLVRQRRSLIEERSSEINRVMKVLESANVKLKSVVTDVLGVSGRAMLEAIIRGEEDTAKIIALADRRLKASPERLQQAVTGSIDSHHRFMLTNQLVHIDQLTGQIEVFDLEIERRMAPFVAEIARLDDIPGVGTRAAQEIIAEIGLDMSRFPTANHLVSWAKMCPGLNESGGKRRTASTGHGNRYLRAALTEAALGATRKRDSYLRARYYRLANKRGHKRAIIATGHSILRISYYLLRDATHYQDLGANYSDHRSLQARMRSSIRYLERNGYTVTKDPAA